MGVINDITQIASGKKILPDSSVWLLGSCPHLEKKDRDRQKRYKQIWKQIESKNYPLVIPFQVLSEVYNRWLKLHFDLLLANKEIKGDPKDFKRLYRNENKYYLPEVQALNNVFKPYTEEIINSTVKNFDKIFTYAEFIDINDALLVQYCMENKDTILFTADADFRLYKHSITILTFEF